MTLYLHQDQDINLAGLALGLARCSYGRERLGLAGEVATLSPSLPGSVTATNSSLVLRCPIGDIWACRAHVDRWHSVHWCATTTTTMGR